MKEDIVIGKARVIQVGEVVLTAPPSVSVPSGPFTKKTVVASVLKIEPVRDVDGFASIHGTMTLPGPLPFGETF